MDGTKTAAVIIPSRGRDACVRQTLCDLASQNFKQFDVWVVDQNEVPLKDLQKSLSDIPLHHECMPPLGSHAGRNRAIFKTNADLCIFIDDDVRITSHFIQDHVRAHQTAVPNSVIAGKVIQPKDGFTEKQMVKLGKRARYNPWLGHVSGNFIGNLPLTVDHLHECNFSAPTTALRKINGFNESFAGNAYFEGTDLALRLIQAGYTIFYHPTIEVTHLQEGKGGNRVQDKAQHTYWFMRNYGLLNSLHMHRIGLPFFVTRSVFYVLAKAVKNLSFKIFLYGFRGLIDGLKYFKPVSLG